MVKIRSGNALRGLPGFKRVSMASPGIKVNKNTSGKFGGVRRLIANDPADGNTANIGTEQDVPTLGAIVKPQVYATKTTALTGANNDVKYTSKKTGVAGNAITIAYVDPGGTTAALGVVVVSNAITVNLGRAASAINTTANLLIAAIKASTAASALVDVALATGNDGTGLVTALSVSNLTGGVNAVTPTFTDTNTVGTPSPAIVKGPNFEKGNAVPIGTERVRDRSKNRSRRVTKF